MAWFVRHQHSVAEAYQAVKSDLLHYRFPPGQRIPVGVVAARLAMSARHVHKACHKLASDGWAIETAGPAFLAWHRDENAVTEQYDINESLLISAVRHAGGDHPACAGARETIGNCRNVLSRGQETYESLAAHTGTLFYTLASMAGEEETKDLVRASNRRLYHLRALECRYLDDVAGELVALCDLALAGSWKALRQAIRVYHQRRRELLPRLIDLLAES